jgi:outer membrane protein, heavy metal efflux system
VLPCTRLLTAGLLTLAVSFTASETAAAQSCSGAIGRDSVARCAVRASLALARAQAQRDVLEGQRTAVSPLLPSNPTLVLSAAHRSTSAQSGANWYATLSQELEIAGQRSARRARADAALHAQDSALVATERDVATLAWRSYFQALAARDLQAAASRLEQFFMHSSRASQAGAAQGLVSGVDAEVAELNVLKLTQQRIEAERNAQIALAGLLTLLGRNAVAEPAPLSGELAPLAPAAALRFEELEGRVAQRAEVARAKQLLEVQRADRSAIERSRVPNITLSLLAQRDGFGEQVLGGGIALPIPLPYPLGRTYHGELTENAALTRQATLELEQLERTVRLEVVEAFYAHAAAKAQAALYTPARTEQAQRSLENLAQALQAGRVPISEAIIAQQTLVEFTRANIQTRLELCLSSIELARAAGLTLEGAGL